MVVISNLNIKNKDFKLSLLSTNLLLTMEELIKDQYLAKLLSVYNKNPIDSDDIDTNKLILENIFPQPYNEEVPEEEKVELRIFYPESVFDSSNNIAVTDLFFQIIYHRNLSRIKINNEMRLREFEIMDRIVNLFKGESIKTLGVINFKGFQYAHIDKDYCAYTLASEIMGM